MFFTGNSACGQGFHDRRWFASDSNISTQVSDSAVNCRPYCRYYRYNMYRRYNRSSLTLCIWADFALKSSSQQPLRPMGWDRSIAATSQGISYIFLDAKWTLQIAT
jgi:hypothetical protein